MVVIFVWDTEQRLGKWQITCHSTLRIVLFDELEEGWFDFTGADGFNKLTDSVALAFRYVTVEPFLESVLFLRVFEWKLSGGCIHLDPPWFWA